MEPAAAAPAPTTSAVAAAARDAATSALEAIVFREILKPLASALGPVGDVALGRVADTLFVRRNA
jgi:hypothetical protein